MQIYCLATSFAQMPWWQLYALQALLAIVSAWGVQVVGGYLALWRYRSEQPEHWTDRARLAFPYATFSATHMILVSIMWAYSGIIVWGTLWAAPPLIVVACYGVLRRSKPAWRKLRGGQKSKSDLRSLEMGHLTVINLALLFLAVCSLIYVRRIFPFNYWIFVAALMLGIIAYRAWISVFVARALGVLQPAPDDLSGRVKIIAREIGIEPPRVYVIRSEVANAYALTTCHSVGFTTAALRILSEAEQDTITRHEIGHLTESRLQRWCRLFSIVIFLPLVAIPVLAVEFGSTGYFLGLVGYLVLARLWSKFSRSMERRADAGAEIVRVDDGDHQNFIYASALEKLYEHNLTPAVLRGGSLSHPNLYDRMIAAGKTPDYPRPTPPPKLLLFVACVPLILVFVLIVKLSTHIEEIRL